MLQKCAGYSEYPCVLCNHTCTQLCVCLCRENAYYAKMETAKKETLNLRATAKWHEGQVCTSHMFHLLATTDADGDRQSLACPEA